MRTASARSSRAPWTDCGVHPDDGRPDGVVPGVGERCEVGHGAALLDLVAGMRREALRQVGEGDEEVALGHVGQLAEPRRGTPVDPRGLGVADDAAQPGVGELGGADGVVRGPDARRLDDVVPAPARREGVVVLLLDHERDDRGTRGVLEGEGDEAPSARPRPRPPASGGSGPGRARAPGRAARGRSGEPSAGPPASPSRRRRRRPWCRWAGRAGPTGGPACASSGSSPGPGRLRGDLLEEGAQLLRRHGASLRVPPTGLRRPPRSSGADSPTLRGHERAQPWTALLVGP